MAGVAEVRAELWGGAKFAFYLSGHRLPACPIGWDRASAEVLIGIIDELENWDASDFRVSVDFDLPAREWRAGFRAGRPNFIC